MKVFLCFVIAALVILSSNGLYAQNSMNQQKITEKEKREISESLAIDIVKRYRKKRYNRVRKFRFFGKRYDSKSFWYSIEDLKKLITKAEALNDDTRKTDGVRMYFGVYPDKTVYSDADRTEQKYSKLHTLLFVPTMAMNCKEGSCHLDRTYPSTQGNDTINALSDQKVILLNLDIKDDGSVVVDNHGELCPPPNPCSGALLIEREKKRAKSKNNAIRIN